MTKIGVESLNELAAVGIGQSHQRDSPRLLDHFFSNKSPQTHQSPPASIAFFSPTHHSSSSSIPHSNTPNLQKERNLFEQQRLKHVSMIEEQLQRIEIPLAMQANVDCKHLLNLLRRNLKVDTAIITVGNSSRILFDHNKSIPSFVNVAKSNANNTTSRDLTIDTSYLAADDDNNTSMSQSSLRQAAMTATTSQGGEKSLRSFYITAPSANSSSKAETTSGGVESSPQRTSFRKGLPHTSSKSAHNSSQLPSSSMSLSPVPELKSSKLSPAHQSSSSGSSYGGSNKQSQDNFDHQIAPGFFTNIVASMKQNLTSNKIRPQQASSISTNTSRSGSSRTHLTHLASSSTSEKGSIFFKSFKETPSNAAEGSNSTDSGENTLKLTNVLGNLGDENRAMVISNDLHLDPRVGSLTKTNLDGKVRFYLSTVLRNLDDGKVCTLIACSASPKYSISSQDIILLDEIASCIEDVYLEKRRSLFETAKSNITLCTSLIASLRTSLTEMNEERKSMARKWRRCEEILLIQHIESNSPSEVVHSPADAISPSSTSAARTPRAALLTPKSSTTSTTPKNGIDSSPSQTGLIGSPKAAGPPRRSVIPNVSLTYNSWTGEMSDRTSHENDMVLLSFSLQEFYAHIAEFQQSSHRLFVAIERTINVARGYLSKDRLQYVNSCSEMSPSDGVVNRLNSILLSMSQHQAPLKKRRSALNTMLPPVSGLPPINTTLNDLFDGEKLHSNNLLWTFQVNSVLAHCAHRTFYDHLTLFLENIIHSWSSFTYTTQIFIEYEAEDITMITDDDGGIPSKTTGEQKTSTEGGKARTPRQQLTRMLSGISSQASTPKSRIGNDAETQDAVGSGNPYVCSIDGFIKLTLLFPDKVEAVDANAAPASPSKAQGNAAKAQKIHPIELVMPLLSLINSSLNRVNTASAATMLSVKQVDEDRDDIDQIEEHNDMIDGVGKDKHGKRAKSKNNKKAAKKKDKKLTPSDGEAVNKEKEQAYHIRVPCLLFLTQSQYQAYFYPTNASIVLSANNPTANPARNPLTKNKQGTKGGVKDDSENLQVAAMSSSMFCSPLCNMLFSNPSSNSDGNLQANMGKRQVSVHRMKKGAIGNKASPANKAGKSKYKKKMGYNATPRTGGSNSGNPLPQEVSQHISLHHGADGDSMRSNAPNTSSSAALFA